MLPEWGVYTEGGKNSTEIGNSLTQPQNLRKISYRFFHGGQHTSIFYQIQR
jgi:hypothetical protein